MQVARTKENLKQCLCMHCPSYTTECKLRSMPKNLMGMIEDLDHVDHFEKMFCAFEKSDCIHENKGCLCEKCPIHENYQLKNEDYCLETGGENPPKK